MCLRNGEELKELRFDVPSKKIYNNEYQVNTFVVGIKKDQTKQ